MYRQERILISGLIIFNRVTLQIIFIVLLNTMIKMNSELIASSIEILLLVLMFLELSLQYCTHGREYFTISMLQCMYLELFSQRLRNHGSLAKNEFLKCLNHG